METWKRICTATIVTSSKRSLGINGHHFCQLFHLVDHHCDHNHHHRTIITLITAIIIVIITVSGCESRAWAARCMGMGRRRLRAVKIKPPDNHQMQQYL